MENFGIILSIIGLCFTILLAVFGGIVWAVRQEGRINLANRDIVSNKAFADQAIANISDKLANAIAALAKFDENTQDQVENYRQNTDKKIDELGKNMSAKFEKVFEKIDGKADKP
jgi:hypothetical protein